MKLVLPWGLQWSSPAQLAVHSLKTAGLNGEDASYNQLLIDHVTYTLRFLVFTTEIKACSTQRTLTTIP